MEEEEIYNECEDCGMKYTIMCHDMKISEVGEDDSLDIWPQFCPFCGNEVTL